eukprot:gene20724-38885_t
MIAAGQKSLSKVGVWLTGRTDRAALGSELLAACPSDAVFDDAFADARELSRFVVACVGRVGGVSGKPEAPRVGGRFRYAAGLLEPLLRAAEHLALKGPAPKRGLEGDPAPPCVAALSALLHACLHKLTFPALPPLQKALVADHALATARALHGM